MSWFRRNRADVSGEIGPIDVLQRDSAALRRWIIVGGCVAVLLLAGLSIVLAWQQYDDAKAQAESDLRARVVAVAALVDTSFTGQIQTLSSIAKAPSVVGQQLPRMGPYFRRVSPPGDAPFTGGIGWIDRDGFVRATNRPGPGPSGSLANRDYFRAVVATHRPYVSAGLIGKAVQQPVIVVAVPTFGPGGTFTGVLAGSTLLRTVGESRQALELGYGNLQLVDRNGRLLLGGLAHVRNTALLERIKGMTTGVVSGRGFDGERRRRGRLRHGAGARLGHGDRPVALVGVRVGAAGAFPGARVGARRRAARAGNSRLRDAPGSSGGGAPQRARAHMEQPQPGTRVRQHSDAGRGCPARVVERLVPECGGDRRDREPRPATGPGGVAPGAGAPDHRECPHPRAGRAARKGGAEDGVARARAGASRPVHEDRPRHAGGARPPDRRVRRRTRRDDQPAEHRRATSSHATGPCSVPSPTRRRARSNAPGASSRSMSSRSGSSGACFPSACRAATAWSSQGTIWRAPTRSRSGATGTTPCGGPTGPSICASATSAARASGRRR